MENIVMNPKNKEYYSDDFIKGWEQGVKDQFNARPRGEWKHYKDEHLCTNCKEVVIDNWTDDYMFDFCPHCGAEME